MNNSLVELLDLLEHYSNLGISTQILIYALMASDNIDVSNYEPEAVTVAYDFLEQIKLFVSDVDTVEGIQSKLSYYMYYENR